MCIDLYTVIGQGLRLSWCMPCDSTMLSLGCSCFTCIHVSVSGLGMLMKATMAGVTISNAVTGTCICYIYCYVISLTCHKIQYR